MTLTLTDLFCGAGGSSTGATSIPGVSVKIAANHWQLAVDTHNTNHPSTDHDCADISQVNPWRYPKTDILWASPECTNHSAAKGRKRDAQPDLFGDTLPDAAAERSRATMWDVVRFAEAHRYQAVIVENVVEAWHWQPFQAWLMAMESLGYQHHIVFLNSMHAQAFGPGAPQSRDRMYVLFWRIGVPRPDIERVTAPEAVCPVHGLIRARQVWKKERTPWGRYRAQYLYRHWHPECQFAVVEPLFRPAAEIIDWTLPGQRIGDRARPLAPKTLARIKAGVERYWAPLLAPCGGSWRDSASPVTEASPTIMTRDYQGLAIPMEGRDGKTAAPLGQPLRTMTTRNETGLAFLTLLRSDRARNSDPASQPLATVVADGSNHALVSPPPFIAELRGGSSDARPASDPLATVTASGNHHALVTCYYGTGGCKPTTDALPTVTSVERHALLMRNNTGGAEMCTPVSEVARTITTSGHQSLLSTSQPPTLELDDVAFRMLEPREIAAAMDFPRSYNILGNRREQVRQAGNAVTPPAARDLVGIVAEALGAR